MNGRLAGHALLAASLALACSPPPRASSPAPAPTTGDLAALLDSAVAAGAAPGAVIGLSMHGKRWYYGTGRLGLDDATRPDEHTVYDLASLTKVVALTSAALHEVEAGALDLDAPVQRYVPEFAGPGKERVTVRHLLTHSSGLPAWRELFREAPTRDSALAIVFATPLDTLPGTGEVYSDLGAILAGVVVERVSGTRLSALANQQVFRPLGMRDTRYAPPESWQARIAPTENDPWRGRILRGEVHDENAARLEGITGHAGLFGTAADLVRYGEWWLEAWATDSVAHAFASRQELVPGSSRAIGWDTPSIRSSAGTRLSNWSFGHTGFTGTSIWIDPSRQLVVVLLTNRVHPTRENTRNILLRRAVADAAAELADHAAR
ncbi:MAG: serine hydrolase domain-containing protein [Gemmatimonadales bacterium]